jgi:hypothetical protein
MAVALYRRFLEMAESREKAAPVFGFYADNDN